MRSNMAVVLLLGTLAFPPGLAAAAGGEDSLEQLVVEMAHTPAQHAALANHYRGKALQARAEAAEHDAMGRAYFGGKLTDRQRMQEHCKKLSTQNNAMAAEYDALAKLHDEQSKKSQ